jgi:glycosyl transferase family 4
MRIAYVATHVEPKNILGGVGQKIRDQMGCWKELGHSTRLFALIPGYSGQDVYAYEGRGTLPGVRELTRSMSRTKALSRLVADVRAYHPDIIYLRCGGYLFPLHGLFSVAPVIIELNTNDIAQRSLRGLYSYWSNMLTRGLVLGMVSGMVAVTREIAELPANRKFRKPFRVIGNGVDLRRFQPLAPTNHSVPTITLVGSAGMAWHGVDKLICLAETCTDLNINIVGYERSDFAGPLPSNVTVYGFLDRKAVAKVLMESDVACGSLALHRNNMQEGSTLKVREALAYGMPILLGYRDTDLMDFESECLLELPNTEDNVMAYAPQIRSFAYRMIGKRIDRDVIATRIDQRTKEETRLVFFEEVTRQGKHV